MSRIHRCPAYSGQPQGGDNSGAARERALAETKAFISWPFDRRSPETADDVRDANEIAGVPYARIVATEEIGIGQPDPEKKGDRS